MAAQNNDAGEAVRANLPQLPEGRARDLAGKAVGVGGKSIDHATKVLTKGTPELVKGRRKGGPRRTRPFLPAARVKVAAAG